MKLTAQQQQLVAKNTGLVRAVIRRLRIAGSGREDAEAEGLLALCQAACTYRPERGAAFSTWGTLRVTWHLRTWLRDTNKGTSIPSRAAGRLGCWWDGPDDTPSPEQETAAAQIERIMLGALTPREGQITLMASNGLTSDEIAHRLGVSLETVARARRQAREAISEVRAIMQSEVSTQWHKL